MEVCSSPEFGEGWEGVKTMEIPYLDSYEATCQVAPMMFVYSARLLCRSKKKHTSGRTRTPTLSPSITV